MSTTPDTAELKALTEFLAASLDSKLDGAKMREAMEWTLGPGSQVQAPPVPEPLASHSEFVGRTCIACRRGSYFLDGNGYTKYPRCDRCNSVPSLSDYAANISAPAQAEPVARDEFFAQSEGSINRL